MLDLRQLSALHAVAQAGSIQRASMDLGWSQPTVAHHLKGLAAEVGAAVVESSSRGSRLTPVGLIIHRHAVPLLKRAARAEEEARAFVAAAHSHLSLGVFPSAGARLLPGIVRALHQADYTVEITESELDGLLAGLEDLVLDAALVFNAPQQPLHLPAGFKAIPVRRERLVIVGPSGRGARRRQVTLADLRDDDWVMSRNTNDPVDRTLHAATASAGFEMTVSARTDDYAVAIAYVAAGFGITVVPELALPRRLEGIAVIDVADVALERHLILATSASVPELVQRTLVKAMTSGDSA